MPRSLAEWWGGLDDDEQHALTYKKTLTAEDIVFSDTLREWLGFDPLGHDGGEGLYDYYYEDEEVRFADWLRFQGAM